MRTRRLLPAVALVVAVTASPAAAQSGKVAVMRLAAAINIASMDGVAAVIDDNITHRDPDGTTFRGKAAFLKHLEPEFAAHAHIFVHDTRELDADTVVGAFTYTSDDVAAAGVNRLLGSFSADARDDKITRFDVDFNAGDEQTRRFLAAADSGGGGDRGGDPSRLPATGDGSLQPTEPSTTIPLILAGTLALAAASMLRKPRVR